MRKTCTEISSKSADNHWRFSLDRYRRLKRSPTCLPPRRHFARPPPCHTQARIPPPPQHSSLSGTFVSGDEREVSGFTTRDNAGEWKIREPRFRNRHVKRVTVAFSRKVSPAKVLCIAHRGAMNLGVTPREWSVLALRRNTMSHGPLSSALSRPVSIFEARQHYRLTRSRQDYFSSKERNRAKCGII